ncbi:MAG: PAS domain S-box protein [Leptospiraceae bacterium]|nr:PAS domain S-box protein [Leptospiraceae bacterium]MCP5497575.1 PAS domain S-box protein [Leptospiraceae bacterium]
MKPNLTIKIKVWWKLISGRLKKFLPEVVMFFVITILFFLTGYGFYLYQKNTITKTKQVELKNITQSQKDKIEYWFYKQKLEGKYFGVESYLAEEIYLWSLEGFGSNHRKFKIQQRLLSIQRNFGYTEVILLDKNKKILYPEREENLKFEPGFDVKFADSLKNNNITFSELYRSYPNDTIFLDLYIPLVNNFQAKQNIGVLLFRNQPSLFLFPLLQSTSTKSETLETLILKKSKNHLVYINELKFQSGTSFQNVTPVFEKGILSAVDIVKEPGFYEGLDYRNKKVLAYMEEIPVTGWLILTKVDENEIYSPIHKTVWILSAFVTILIFITVGILSLVWWIHDLNIKRDYKAEKERQAIRSHYDYLTKYANDIILLTDSNGQIIEANNKTLHTYQYSRKEILQKNIRELCVPDFLDVFENNWHNVRSKEGLIYEIIHTKKDGTVFPVEISSRTIITNGNIYRQEIIRDISIRKKYELELQYNRDLLKNLTDAIPGVVFIFEHTPQKKDRITFISNGVKELFGIESGEVILNIKIILDTIINDDKKEFLVSVENAIDKKEMWMHEFRIHSSNIIKWVKGKAVLNTINNDTLQWYGLLTDITTLKNIEESLRRERKLFIGGPVVVFRTQATENLIIEYVSPNIIQFGFKKDFFQSQGREYYSIIHPDDIERVREKIKTASKSGANFIEHEYYRIISGFGEIRWIFDFTVIIRSEWGDIKHFDVYIMDVTDRKYFEEELTKSKEEAEKASKVKSLFLANISHELRTPLNGILGYTQLLQKEKNMTEMQKRGIRVIEQSGNHLLTLINDILDLSKIEAKKVELNEQSFSLRPFLLGIVEMVKAKSLESNVFFDYRVGNFVPTHVHTDSRRLTQILLNLLSNAVKFTKQGKVILKVSYNKRSQKLAFLVGDTGIGIPKDMLNDIYEPFKRIKNVGDIEGTGLGLSITKRLIKLMGSELRVKSKKDVGSVFAFKIKTSLVENSINEFLQPIDVETKINKDIEKMIKLPKEKTEHLVIILEKGDIKKFKEELNDLKDIDESSQPFIHRLEDLAGKFQINQIIELLKE